MNIIDDINRVTGGKYALCEMHEGEYCFPNWGWYEDEEDGRFQFRPLKGPQGADIGWMVRSRAGNFRDKAFNPHWGSPVVVTIVRPETSQEQGLFDFCQGEPDYPLMGFENVLTQSASSAVTNARALARVQKQADGEYIPYEVYDQTIVNAKTGAREGWKYAGEYKSRGMGLPHYSDEYAELHDLDERDAGCRWNNEWNNRRH